MKVFVSISEESVLAANIVVIATAIFYYFVLLVRERKETIDLIINCIYLNYFGYQISIFLNLRNHINYTIVFVTSRNFWISLNKYLGNILQYSLQIVLSAVLACAFGTSLPLVYAKLVPGAPIGLDGRVVDTAEVALAKAEHAAAHINEKINLAAEAARSADQLAYIAPSNAAVIGSAQLVQPVAVTTKLVPGAPIGLDGRVVDTPEVALAKAEHAAAHINEKLSHEARSVYYEQPAVILDRSAPFVHYYLR